MQNFGALLEEKDENEMSAEEARERRIMTLLLKVLCDRHCRRGELCSLTCVCVLQVKNGTPPQRKTALRQITDNARKLGAGPLFNQILPLLMSPTLEDQVRSVALHTGYVVVFCVECVGNPRVARRNGTCWSR